MSDKAFGSVTRPIVEESDWKLVLDMLGEEIRHRVRQHGAGAYVGPHEIRGSMQEEIVEVDEAIHDNNYHGVQRELLDVAVACVFGIASLWTLGATRRPGEGVAE